jgi:lauroyl/myristoyl acyltransferase
MDERSTHHIWRGKIAHHELMRISTDNLSDLLGDILHRHLRLLVVCCHLGRWDEMTLLMVKLLLDTAVEEEGDVGVFLRLCEPRKGFM